MRAINFSHIFSTGFVSFSKIFNDSVEERNSSHVKDVVFLEKRSTFGIEPLFKGWQGCRARRPGYIHQIDA
jgi:hypothetical protein